ncbi:MAG: hypothetical protein IPK06_17710 [Ignavibacteriae bacterium]|nr:hypothetical protein [Ignavibacteriota bacterium]
MERREFIRISGLIIGSFLVTSKMVIANNVNVLSTYSNEFVKKIISIIIDLKNEGSNLVKKIMSGKKYEYNPYTHYPYDGGIKDEETGYQVFFHIHRENEYGHFHTFATDENGELLHLVLISMSEDGKPIGISTVNRWVTGDKYVKANILKTLAKNFSIDPNLYIDKRVIEFINNIFKAYTNEIENLFDDRDLMIKNYVDTNFREPFEDRELEILSFKEIKI